MIRTIRAFFRSNYEMLKRMIFWGWNMRHSYDFDAHSIYLMLHLKLERVYGAMKNGNCLWNDDESNNRMRKLLEAKGLAKRIYDEKYSSYYSIKFMEKYRSSKHGCGLSDMMGELYPKSKVIDEAMWSHMFRKACKKDSKHAKMDIERFHYLMSKYTQHWWD